MLNGYRASHRNRWFLISKRILTLQEFLLFEYYLDLMGFDKSHCDKFAVFTVYFDEITLVFNKHQDTIRNWHDGLIAKGFIKIFDEKRKLYTVKSPLRYVIGLAQWGGEASKYTKEEKNQTQEFILKNIRFFRPESEKILPKSDNLALKPSISTENSLGSSKDCSIVSSPIGSKKVVVIKQEVRSDSEYQKMCQDGGFTNLTPDDMKWIDQNITEEIEIENDEQEKSAVEIFFNGDWDKYQKSLFLKTKVRSSNKSTQI